MNISFNIGRTRGYQEAIERLPGVSRTALRISDDPGITITVASEQARDMVDMLVSDRIEGQTVKFDINPKLAPKHPELGSDPNNQAHVISALEKAPAEPTNVTFKNGQYTIFPKSESDMDLLDEVLEDRIGQYGLYLYHPEAGG